MARKKSQNEQRSQEPEAQIRPELISQTLTGNYMPYAMSVIISRAIPEIDGFKPSHRKLLYTMYKMGLLKGPRTKSANIVGQTMKLNPHGDQAIYETMVRLTRGNQALLHPYIDSKGNFGKQYSSDMQYAAARYTEAKLDSFCQLLFSDIDHDVVDFVDNYDGTLQEPTLLPARFPSVLVNSNQGIAVGMASNICSFNLREVCQATAAYIRNPEVDLMDYMPAPDFSSGAELVYDPAKMRNIYETGRGSFKLRARYRVLPKEQVIEIYELPYTVYVEQIVDDIAALVKAGKIKEITDVRDETDLSGLKLTIDYRRQADPEQIMQKLFAKTRLEDSFSCNFNILVNGRPRVLGLRQILGEWLNFRKACFRRGLEYELGQKTEQLHLLRGLEQLLLDIDRAVAIIRGTEKESEVVPNLAAGFAIDQRQAEYIAEIKLRHLNREYILKRTADIRKLEQEIRRLKGLLSNEGRIHEAICQDLERIAADYGQERCTQLIHEAELEQISEEALIEDYRLRLFLTEHGYIKKLALTSLRGQAELKTKEEDRIIEGLDASNRQELIFFSNRCRAYKLFAYEIPDHRPSDLGAYGQNLLGLEDDEQIVYIYSPGDYQGELVAAFQDGKVARFSAASFETKTRRRRLLNAYGSKAPLVAIYAYRPGQEPVSPEQEGQETQYSAMEEQRAERGDGDFFLSTDGGKQILFNAELLPAKTSRQTQGVQVLKLKKNERVTAFCRRGDGAQDEPEYYRVRKIPARGFYRKEEALSERQASLSDLT